MLECPEEAWHGWVSKGLVCLRNGTGLHLSCPYICVCIQLGGGFTYFLFSPLFGEDSHFD